VAVSGASVGVPGWGEANAVSTVEEEPQEKCDRIVYVRNVAKSSQLVLGVLSPAPSVFTLAQVVMEEETECLGPVGKKAAII
jgi:hypothetical protein